jgi:SEC-C motif-containing protein
MDYFQSFLDATPEKGVIIVEYYWQPPTTNPCASKRRGRAGGANTSMVFFRRIRASDECWCGSKRRFSRCHRRDDDWTFVTLDPDQAAYSPVVLLERTLSQPDSARSRTILETERGLLPMEQTDFLAAWGVPIEPTIVNETGQLILGTIGISQREMHVETNSEKRFVHLMARYHDLLGAAAGNASTFRAEPQKAFPRPPSAKRRKRAAQ